METTRYPLTVEHTPVLIRSSWNFDETKLFEVGKTKIEGKLKLIKVREENNYKNCKLNGPSIGWYKNGQKQYEIYYKDGKRHGLSIWWYENGQKMSERHYKDGEENGLSVGWYEDGQKHREVNYKDDKMDGLFIWWYRNGQKMTERYYKNGKIVYQKIYKEV